MSDLDAARILNGDTMKVSHKWYKNIEKGIRRVVKLLRNNGINTTYSCHHAMVIEAENYSSDEIDAVYNLLVQNGYEGFTLELKLFQEFEERPRRFLRIQFHKCPCGCK